MPLSDWYVKAVLALLRKVEWRGPGSCFSHSMVCPRCGASNSHMPDCELAAMINELSDVTSAKPGERT